MARLSKAIILGGITGVCGLIISFVSIVHELEVDLGLDLLFVLRGVRDAPPEVVVVSLDKSSAEKLNLPYKPDKWSRSLHAHIIENLIQAGARVIAFDLFFSESRPGEDDRLLAQSIDRAGNVVLVEGIERERIETSDNNGLPSGALHIEKRMPPIPPLLRASAAVAPFPLPKVPVKVSQYWTFKTSAGDTPTMPVTVFQLFSLDTYDDFIRLLEEAAPGHTDRLPRNRDELMKTSHIINVMRDLRDIFETSPAIANAMLERLNRSHARFKTLKSLIHMYRSSVSNYINYYGPPYTITTVPYYRVLQLEETGTTGEEEIDFNGKAVFIGASEIFKLDQRDGFYSVFSKANGVDISGVEIAATAFANLLEDMPVRPLPFNTQLIIILLWGAGAGFFCRYFPNGISFAAMIISSSLYLIIAFKQFAVSATWYPLVVPLVVQVPFAFISSFAWKYVDINREKTNIRKAFSFYLPDEVINNISHSFSYALESSRVAPGIFLSTDVEHYTSLSEQMTPDELGSHLNKYFEVIFRAVKSHDGVISNVIADSVLAFWGSPDAPLGRQASLAALDIMEAVRRFNESMKDAQLPTRIGLHYGDVILGKIGALDRFELRHVGDTVNTATRIEGLNKLLGTRVLMSDEVFTRSDGFLCRELGTFLLLNKLKPVVVHELISLADKSTEEQRDLCALFSDALGEFNRQSWNESSDKFNEIIKRFGEDGPSSYYLNLCEQYMKKPPDESWDGIIRIDKK